MKTVVRQCVLNVMAMICLCSAYVLLMLWLSSVLDSGKKGNWRVFFECTVVYVDFLLYFCIEIGLVQARYELYRELYTS